MAHHIEAKAGKVAPKQSPKKRGTATHNAVKTLKTKRQAKKIIEALHEAEQIHKGTRKGKTLDEFLKEL